MFTVVTPTMSLSLDDHFIKRPAATFFVTVEGGGMAEHGILAGDTLIVDRSRTPGSGSIVIAALEGELTAPSFRHNRGRGYPHLGRRRRGGAEPAMSIYGLADCNNFFVSCERVFRPALEGRPAVVLSSNDGCIVARSDEAKALGVKMAQPAFQAKNLIEQHSIAVISGNLQFYTDMSNRVMQAFGELVPAVEKYSIDECFLDLTGIPQELTAFCQDLKRTVRQWTGLPISIGIAETKTLAKIANRLAKTSAKTDGVLDLTGTRWRDRALASTEIGDIWGIGRQYAQKLNRNGVVTALDLARRPDGWVRKEMGVGGLKTVRERRSGQWSTSRKLHYGRAATARTWRAGERMRPGPLGRRGREREDGSRRPAGRSRLTHSKTAAIRTAIAVIAALFLAGYMTGDHGMKRMA